MALSATGSNSMKKSIIDQLPDPMIEDVTKAEALTRSGGDDAIEAVSSAVVDELKGATASLTFTTTGACSNTSMSPGSFTGSISASSTGSISGMSSADLKRSIKDNIEDSIGGVDFSVGNSDDTIEAISDAVVEEIHNNGKISLSATSVSGTVVAGGGTPIGTITAKCDIDSLDATRLRNSFRSKIDENIDEDVDFDSSRANTILLSLARGIINHIHSRADVNVSTDFSGVVCSSAAVRTGSVSEDSASIS